MSDSPQSPPKDVDQAVHSADEEPMNDQDPHGSGLAGYEFEGVKEQDRWLPIANGRFSPKPRSCVVICPSCVPSLQPCIPCLTIRPSHGLAHHGPKRLTSMMMLMLTFATLLQWLES
jgi:hypothetical protein